MINYDSSADAISAAETSSDGQPTSSSSSRNGSRARTRARPRVEVVTEIDSNLMDDSYVQQPDDQQRDGGTVTSQLTIRDVTDVDSGNYTCAPSNAEPASTMVYVSEGKFNLHFVQLVV